MKDSLDGVLIETPQPYCSILCFSKDAKMYIHDSAAGGYPILVNHDDQNKTDER
jgi:hypothetical protein